MDMERDDVSAAKTEVNRSVCKKIVVAVLRYSTYASDALLVLGTIVLPTVLGLLWGTGSVSIDTSTW